MKCKKHPGDLSSGAGVCASCLRERLFALIAAQAQAQVQAQAHARAAAHGRSFAAAAAAAEEDRRKSDAAQPPPLSFPRSVSPYVSRRKSDTQPPPLSFPRSVSPYVSRRKSDRPTQHHQHRFYSTPQVAPTYSAASEGGGGDLTSQRSFKKKSRKFSLLAYLFRSRSEKFDADPNPDSSSDSDPRATRASPAPSWLSFLPGRRRAQQSRPPPSVEGSAAAAGRCGKPSRIPARGMSPAREEDSDENPGVDRSPSGNVCSAESSPGWRGTPASAAAFAPKSATRTRPSGHVRSVSGFAFCLSPLVRASPSRNRKQKGGGGRVPPPEAGYSGEIRAPAKPHLAAATPFCKNRSRKLADFGRAHHDR